MSTPAISKTITTARAATTAAAPSDSSRTSNPSTSRPNKFKKSLSQKIQQFPAIIYQQFEKIIGAPGDNAAMATCCTVRTLDEAATILDGVQGKAKTGVFIPNPSHPSEVAVVGATFGIGLMGVIASFNIFRHYAQNVRDYKKSRQFLKNYKPTSFTFNEEQQIKKAAYLKYHNQQINHSRFEKWFAGVCAGSATVGVATGAMLKYATPIGLYIACTHSLARVGKNIFEFTRAWKNLHQIKKIKTNSELNLSQTRLKSLSIQAGYFKRVRKWAALNMATWGLEAIGTGVMGTMNLAAWGVSVKTGFAALPILAPLIIVTSAVGVLWTNNKITSDAYQPGLNTRELKEIENICDPKINMTLNDLKGMDEIDETLIHEDAKHQLYSDYKKFVLSHAGWGIQYKARRWGLRFLGIATIRLAHKWVMKLKFKNKQAFIRRAKLQFNQQNTPIQLEQKRLNMLQQLNIQPKNIKINIEENSEYKNLGKNHQMTIKVDDQNIKTKTLQLIELLGETTERGQIFKLVAKKLLSKKSSENPYKDSSENSSENSSEKYFGLKKEFQEFQELLPQDDFKDLLQLLNQINQTKPCCSAEGDAYMALGNFEDFINSDTFNGLRNDAQEKIYNVLSESIDQYCIFQMGKESNREIAKYTEIAVNWRNIEAKNSAENSKKSAKNNIKIY